MSVVTEYPTGAPCWFELATTDQNAAKQFYSELFGWSISDSPMGNDQFYTMFQMEGENVGAAYSLMADMVAQGIPPHWMVYFATKNADDTAAKVTQFGGAIIQSPFPVMEYGTMAVCRDPGGAVFSIWQAKTHPGAGIINEDGAVCWSELATRDAVGAREFYTKVFGWDIKASAGMATYAEFSAGGQPRGGIMPMDEHWEGIPSHWGIYFLVSDCDASVAQAKQLGGAVRHGPFDAPGVGRIAVMADPQGAGFSLITLKIAA